MLFNAHSDLAGRHAFLSASKYHWTNYSDEKLVQVYSNQLAAQHGTRVHNYASEAILLGFKQPKSSKTLNAYVNDAIGFRMTPEQTLFYSDHAFGTADAISFKDNFLRIHDLKTGVIPGSFRQLEIYVALFCLEYGFKPAQIDIELRIYQSDEVKTHNPDYDEITRVMGKIVEFDKMISSLIAEAMA